MARQPVPVRAKEAADHGWIDAVLREQWGDGPILVHGASFDARALPALIAGNREGLATYAIDAGRGEAELVTLNALVPAKGIGNALLLALRALLAGDGVMRLRVTTTNDNLRALGFYQKRGFRLTAVRPGAVAEGRRLKPSIPLFGSNGIPLNDEIDLVMDLKR